MSDVKTMRLSKATKSKIAAVNAFAAEYVQLEVVQQTPNATCRCSAESVIRTLVKGETEQRNAWLLAVAGAVWAKAKQEQANG